jgi:uncharacterized protein (TIGR03067 family)
MNPRLLPPVAIVLFWATSVGAQDATQPSRSSKSPPVSSNAAPSPLDVVLIETTPALEATELIRNVLDSLEKDGIAKRVQRYPRPPTLTFSGHITVKSDASFDSVYKLVSLLKHLAVPRVTFQVANADGANEILVTCLPDVTWLKVVELKEELSSQLDFKSVVRVATTMTRPALPENALPDLGIPLPPHVKAPPGAKREPRSAGDGKPYTPDDDTVAVFALRHAQAKEVGRLIELVIGREISAVVDEHANQIHVRGSRNAVLKETQELIKRLDVPRKVGSARSEHSIAAGTDSELAGTWEVERTIKDGIENLTATDYVYYRWRFDTKTRIASTEWQRTLGESHTGDTMRHTQSRFTLDGTKTPKQITIYGDGLLLLAIYELKGDRLRVAMFGKSEVERPQAFDSKSQNNAGPLVVFELNRLAQKIEDGAAASHQNARTEYRAVDLVRNFGTRSIGDGEQTVASDRQTRGREDRTRIVQP